MYDILIKNGLVIDGSGAPAVPMDVAVTGDTIVAMGRLDGESRATINAHGLAVTPGFIDLHSHTDFNFFLDRQADSKTTQGVTLEYVGNCGVSFCAPLIGDAAAALKTRAAWYDSSGKVPGWADFGSYLDALAENGATLNIATQVGHGTVRRAVLGMESRAPDIDELKRMQSLVAESLDAGALGFSTGLSMAPGSYSLGSEVYALVEVTARRDKLYSSHARDSGSEGPGLFVATEELIESGRRTGCRLQYSHIKANGPMRGRAGELLRRMEQARAEGVDIAADQYPYISASGPMSGNVFPRWALQGGRDKALQRLKDSDLRVEVRAGFTHAVNLLGGPDRIMIASYAADNSLEGRRLDDIAAEWDVEFGEALARLYEGYDAQLILTGMGQPDVDLLASHPLVAVGSDGSSLRTEGPLSSGNPHPRSYGTFPRFLAEMVREKKLATLEEAVRKMTSLPSERLRLTRRGRLAPGFFADIAIFNASTVRDNATFTDPHQYSTGVEHVLVNGVPVVRDGKPTGETPGHVLRDRTH